MFITWAALRPAKPQFTLQDMNLLTFNALATAPTVTSTMSQDIQAEIVQVNVKASRIVRWQVGTISGKHHINVNCPTNIYFGKKDGAYIASPAIKYPLLEKCHVE
nr:hypothetical protein [Tanacetum cinerariifolium]